MSVPQLVTKCYQYFYHCTKWMSSAHPFHSVIKLPRFFGYSTLFLKDYWIITIWSFACVSYLSYIYRFGEHWLRKTSPKLQLIGAPFFYFVWTVRWTRRDCTKNCKTLSPWNPGENDSALRQSPLQWEAELGQSSHKLQERTLWILIISQFIGF